MGCCQEEVCARRRRKSERRRAWEAHCLKNKLDRPADIAVRSAHGAVGWFWGGLAGFGSDWQCLAREKWVRFAKNALVGWRALAAIGRVWHALAGSKKVERQGAIEPRLGAKAVGRAVVIYRTGGVARAA